ncbi:hypothetical protein [Pseudoalteromonas peptidolytica]|uniref:hypothetical protein n=1 Tax=Pseudoalteromonas peptidolytica TaxID=61150 RepID=UPI00298DAA3C|nr:hypothetical protein [Pseudoalteromonas peptidolytica]MDW7549778.1 hypothetical protein [Pseudoalteromonas peptidolytica]
MSIFSQISFVRRQREFWLFLGLFAFLALLSFTGVYKQINLFGLQWFSKFNKTQATEVVVIEAKNLQQQHESLINTLSAYDPKGIVVYSDVALAQDTGSKHDAVYYPLNNPNLCLPETQNWYGSAVSIIPPPQPCDVLWDVLFPEHGTYQNKIIDYSLSYYSLPKFTAERVLNGDVFASQVTDKVVLIAQYSPFALLNAPRTFTDKALPPVYLQAFIANNFAANSFIKPLDKSIVITFVFIATLLLLVWYQRNTTLINVLIAVCMSGLLLILGFAAHYWYAVLLPIGELITLIWSTLLWVFISLKWSEEENLQSIITLIQQRMLGRYLPRHFLEHPEPWDGIIQLVNQQLNLDKSIFLTRLEGDHRVSEVRALNCQLSDIVEMRRDYERVPYSDAIKASGTIKITRVFFKDLAENEQQYIAPLMYAGDIRGFWALTVIPQKHFDEQAFIKNVNLFAHQIGELLFHYKVFTTERKNQKGMLARALTFSLKAPLSHKIKDAVSEMDQKLTSLEHVFNQLQSASILYNLFGQIVQVNESLEQFARRHGLSVFDMSALDLLCFCTSMDNEVAKGKLRYLTLQRGKVVLPIYLDNHTYLLCIRTLVKGSTGLNTSTPFETSGVLFEFIDLGELLQQVDDRTEFVTQLSRQFSSDDQVQFLKWGEQ